jgi:hypothetical protein
MCPLSDLIRTAGSTVMTSRVSSMLLSLYKGMSNIVLLMRGNKSTTSAYIIKLHDVMKRQGSVLSPF